MRSFLIALSTFMALAQTEAQTPTSLQQIKSGPVVSNRIVDTDKLVLNRDALDRIHAIAEPETEKLKLALKKNLLLQQSLEKDLADIAALKDSSAKKKAIAAYQAKHKKSYELVMKQAGVSLSQIASKINTAVPGFKATVNRDFTITIAANAPATLESSPPAPTTRTSRVRDFTDRRELGCGAIAGSSATFSNSSISLKAFAAEAGGCSNDATRRVNLSIPSNATKAVMVVEGDAFVEGFALGIGGISSVTLMASLRSELASKMVVAPYLWAGYGLSEVTGVRREIDIDLDKFRNDRPYRNFLETICVLNLSTVSVGVIAGTNGVAEIRNLEVSLAVTTP